MNISNQIFGKDLDELSYHDIETHFSEPRKETDLIEYKSFSSTGKEDEKFNNIYKGVCAFLNSDGGLLIWGAPKENSNKEFTGNLTPISPIPDKERIVSKISTNIIPFASSFRVKIIKNNDGSGCIIIIEVQASQYSPHQVNNTYYMRLDSISRPAPHHYVEALFKKIKYPELRGYVKFKRAYANGDINNLEFDVLLFNCSPIQNELHTKFYLKITPGTLPTGLHEGTFVLNEVLTYGTPYVKTFVASFNEGDLISKKYVFEADLIVAGQYSPPIVSQYKLNLEDARNTTHLNVFLVKESLNKLLVDVHKDDGFSLSKLINTNLGREVEKT